MKTKTGGSSNNPCSDTFAGPVKDSELETKALENAILKKTGLVFLNIYGLHYHNWWSSMRCSNLGLSQ